MAIVELDREPRDRRPRGRDAVVIAALLGCGSLFASGVWITRPVATSPTERASTAANVPPEQSWATFVYNDGSFDIARLRSDPVLTPPTLAFPQAVPDVTLGAIPDRLANEAPPSNLSNVVWVRGRAGIATAPLGEGSAVISWTEGGMAYWLVSPSYTIDELVKLADELRLRPPTWRP